MRRFAFLSTLLIVATVATYAQIHVPIGERSTPADAKVSLELIARFQKYDSTPKHAEDRYDTHINSPKSALIHPTKNKFYVNALEGYETIAYDLETFKRTAVIEHAFDKSNQDLFLDTLLFDYSFRTRGSRWNEFKGKPVEMTLTHGGKYLWVTYYRRDFDRYAVDPSAVAIIDTDTDEIVRVMPTAPLPKMIDASPDGKWVAITHWGDNTVGIVDVTSKDPREWEYVKHFVVDYRYEPKTGVNRDQSCGFCLRGTVFTPDGGHLLVGRMGGESGIAVFDMDEMKYLGTVFGNRYNLRHIVIKGGYLYCSINRSGYVQKTSLENFMKTATASDAKRKNYSDWEEVRVGAGTRTIAPTPDGRYIIAAANSASRVAVIDAEKMEKVCEVRADSYPVGLDTDGEVAIVTSQGRSGGGGFSVMVFRITRR
ncbi:MAG: peptidoglycan-binding protein [Ignavibacteriales bacterium]|nr:peptidoglycan-binding protein [Ignavibacteriales bacterium]